MTTSDPTSGSRLAVKPAVRLSERLAETIGAGVAQVDAAVALLDGGATVPFISRYRKEATGGLTDTQLRLLEERLGYLREFDARRVAVLESIAEQGKLDDALRARIEATTTKAELEDLYLPYKKKRRTKGQIAIEAGLEPLADSLWDDPSLVPEAAATGFVDAGKGVEDAKAALDGAQAILMERFAEDPVLVGRLRDKLSTKGQLYAEAFPDKATEGAKFADYFDHREPLSKVPGHRALAMFRARAEGVLNLKVQLEQPDGFGDAECVGTVAGHVGFRDRGLPADKWRERVVA